MDEQYVVIDEQREAGNLIEAKRGSKEDAERFERMIKPFEKKTA